MKIFPFFVFVMTMTIVSFEISAQDNRHPQPESTQDGPEIFTPGDLSFPIPGEREPLVVKGKSVEKIVKEQKKILGGVNNKIASLAFVKEMAREFKLNAPSGRAFNDLVDLEEGDYSYYSNGTFTESKIKLLFKSMSIVVNSAEEQWIVIPSKGDLRAISEKVMSEAKKIAIQEMKKERMAKRE